MSKLPGRLLIAAAVIVQPMTSMAQDAPKAGSAAPTTSAPKTAKDNPLQLSNDAPTVYTVVKGDTLWDISGKFLKEPWRWPEIWNMNRDQIKNPHLIYPGDIVKLSFDASGKPLLTLISGGSDATSRLAPRIREQSLGQAIPSIPARVIGPFLSAPLVVEEGAMAGAARIVAAEEGRVIVGAGNTVYGIGLEQTKGARWQIYRPGKALVDPKTREVLGYEASYLGDARVTRFGEGNTPSTLEITKSTQEINRGDRLTPASDPGLPQYSPRSPDKAVSGQVISVVGGVAETAQYSIVVLNVGRREGMEIGHVLAAMTGGEAVSTSAGDDVKGFSLKSLLPASWRTGPDGIPPEVKLPYERNGLLVVFRVFDRVSYALVMSSKRQMKVGDPIQTP
jgi:nucleoid-associated protein YgaU